ncbi:hypothetical protein [Actinokineospora sp. HUAS TT18]|uniref:hypothetical protein n=1 Tax=Actinokineospora sp. HUAS TT18 TaxID=3447451 RepID=UPI003F5262A2
MSTRLTTCWVITPCDVHPDDVEGFPHSPSRAAADVVLAQAAARGALSPTPDRWGVVALPWSCWTAFCTGCGVPLDSEGANQVWHFRGWAEIAETAATCDWRAEPITARVWCPTCTLAAETDGRWDR